MIWKAFMEQIHTGLEVQDFAAYIKPDTEEETQEETTYETIDE